jgi:hypothetical protein
VRGVITKIDPDATLPLRIAGEESDAAENSSNRGSLTINGDVLYFFSRTKELRPDGAHLRLDIGQLHVGQRVGAYVEYVPGLDRVIALAHFIETDPPSGDIPRTLEQLAARNAAASFVFFGVVAGLVGLFIGAADGVVCRLPSRAFLAGSVGLLVGLAGGFLSGLFANVVYAPLNNVVQGMIEHSGRLPPMAFLIQMGGRSLAWSLAGCAMGLGQGIALRSKKLLLYGLLGGLLGGLIGGLLFDPIDLLLLGPDKPSAHWSRLVGIGVIGAGVGAMMGIVELLARNAWLRMTQGPLTGKEFLVFKDVMNVGSSPRSDIYLFNDPGVAPDHAILRTVGDECELEARDTAHAVLVNNRPIRRARLRHGDNVTIGRTMFVFQRRKG